jgi:hypothetical protein
VEVERRMNYVAVFLVTYGVFVVVANYFIMKEQ